MTTAYRQQYIRYLVDSYHAKGSPAGHPVRLHSAAWPMPHDDVGRQFSMLPTNAIALFIEKPHQDGRCIRMVAVRLQQCSNTMQTASALSRGCDVQVGTVVTGWDSARNHLEQMCME